jgi:hypothetical protein
VSVRWALGALVVALVSMAGTATAQPEPTQRARPARLITLAVTTDRDEDVAQIVASLRPLLEVRGFVLAVRRVDSLAPDEPVRSGSQPGVRGRVWLDLQTHSQAEVLFAAGDQPPTARRVVPTAARIDQVGAAEIAEIILAGLLAPQGALAASAPSSERAPGLPATPGPWQLSVGMLGAASSWAGNAVAVPEVGLSLLLEWRPAGATWTRAVWSTLRYRPPFEAAQSPFKVRVRGAEGDVLAVLAHPLGRRGSVGLAAGLGLDARFADATGATALTRPQSVRELAPFVRTALRVDLRLDGPLILFAALSLDLLPLQGRLVVRESTDARALLTPWPLRPGALAGASFRF